MATAAVRYFSGTTLERVETAVRVLPVWLFVVLPLLLLWNGVVVITFLHRPNRVRDHKIGSNIAEGVEQSNRANVTNKIATIL